MNTATILQNREQELVKAIAGDFKRHPRQVNGLFEADAEILSIGNEEEEWLVIKTDTIIEEIRLGLYEDPWLIGWMTITAPVSDMAAAGVQPAGLLLSLVLPKHYNQEWLSSFKRGIQDALTSYQCYIIGGDTNFDQAFSASATAVATTRLKPLTRKGIQPGENIYSTYGMGTGNAYAYTKLFDAGIRTGYQPYARLNEMNLIRKYASACIDSSDGFFPALAVLAEVNKLGFGISIPLSNLLTPEAAKISNRAGLPAWMLLAGPHGDYELLFSVPDEQVKDFEFAAKKTGWQPLYLGRAKKEFSLHFISESVTVKCQPALIPNLFFECGDDIHQYFEILQRQHHAWSTT